MKPPKGGFVILTMGFHENATCELVWGDYDLCFPIADLYHNRLTPDAALKKAA